MAALPLAHARVPTIISRDYKSNNNNSNSNNNSNNNNGEQNNGKQTKAIFAYCLCVSMCSMVGNIFPLG